MLTKTDLNQIAKIIKPLHQDISDTKKQVSNLKKDIDHATKNTVIIKATTQRIDENLKTTTNFFDKEYLDLKKRIRRIEDHLNLPPLT